jgi:hypothetical protein
MTEKIDYFTDLLEQVWQDENFKTRFIANPKTVLAERGVNFPDSLTVEIHEDSLNLRNYVLLKKELLEGVDIQQEDPLVQQVLQQALADESFKAQLLENPKEAIKEATGQDLPESLTVRIYENTPTLKHMVIPLNPANEELSDLELEMVAGGGGKGPSGNPPWTTTGMRPGPWY